MSHPESVVGKLRYLAADSVSPAFYIGAPGENTRWVGTYDEFDMVIENARLRKTAPAMEVEGFELVQHGTTDVDFNSDEAVEENYYPQVAELFQRYTGASDVIVFDHTVRTDAVKEGVRNPAWHVHNDYTPASTIHRVIDVVGGDAAIDKLRKRFVQLNLWRPINNAVLTSPLAVVDAQTVSLSDYVKADVHYSDRRGEVYEVNQSGAHQWYYFPEMTPDEALIFKGFDSHDEKTCGYTPHTAFNDPTSPKSSPPRNSIELRAIAFFD